MRNYRLKNGPSNKKIKQFINTLDNRASVDANDLKYKPLMDDLNRIFDNISRKMSKMNNKCRNMKKSLTGSIKAGVKVDLPFEVEFMFALQLMVDEGFQPLTIFPYKKLIEKVIKSNKPVSLRRG